jgi:hypothetical protein
MNSSGDWTVDTIEVPPSVLWKRTLLLTVVSIGIGLSAGYFLGRSFPAKENPTSAARTTVSRVRFLPLPTNMHLSESGVFWGDEDASRDLPLGGHDAFTSSHVSFRQEDRSARPYSFVLIFSRLIPGIQILIPSLLHTTNIVLDWIHSKLTGVPGSLRFLNLSLPTRSSWFSRFEDRRLP